MTSRLPWKEGGIPGMCDNIQEVPELETGLSGKEHLKMAEKG